MTRLCDVKMQQKLNLKQHYRLIITSYSQCSQCFILKKKQYFALENILLSTMCYDILQSVLVTLGSYA